MRSGFRWLTRHAWLPLTLPWLQSNPVAITNHQLFLCPDSSCSGAAAGTPSFLFCNFHPHYPFSSVPCMVKPKRLNKAATTDPAACSSTMGVAHLKKDRRDGQRPAASSVDAPRQPPSPVGLPPAVISPIRGSLRTHAWQWPPP